MPRCLMSVAAALALAVPALNFTPVQAQTTAQLARPIPIKSLRGELAFGVPPQILLNGQPAQLAPGARIRDTNNMIVLSGALTGRKGTANYMVDTYGLVADVWLLRDDEIAQLWPTTPAEAATWSYDPIQHIWIKP